MQIQQLLPLLFLNFLLTITKPDFFLRDQLFFYLLDYQLHLKLENRKFHAFLLVLFQIWKVCLIKFDFSFIIDLMDHYYFSYLENIIHFTNLLMSFIYYFFLPYLSLVFFQNHLNLHKHQPCHQHQIILLPFLQ